MFDKVLQIGINYFGTEYELNGCINDVKNLNEFLRKDLGADKAEYRILTDDKTNPREKPTRANILEGFRWLVSGATNKSKLFVHYSGHGSWKWDRNGDEADKKDEVICPIDGEIVDDEMRKVLVEELPEGCQLWGIFDCCHSGTVMDLRYNYKMQIQNGVISYHIYPDGKYKDSKSQVYIFSGCRDDQTGADAWEEGMWRGAMTWSFIKSFRSLKKRNRTLRYKEFMKPLIQNLQLKGYKQVPQITTSRWVDLNSEMFI